MDYSIQKIKLQHYYPTKDKSPVNVRKIKEMKHKSHKSQFIFEYKI